MTCVRSLLMHSNRSWFSKLLLIITVLLTSSLSAHAQLVSPHGQFVRISPIQRSLLPPDEARDLFNAGEALYDQRKFTEAEKRFREVVSRFPRNPIADKADYYLIRTLTQVGRNSDALARINFFARQYPKSNWLNDVQEIRMRLTNQVPMNAEFILLGQTVPAPAPPKAPNRINATQASVPPSPPTPFAYPGSGPSPFMHIELQNSDPEISLQQEI